MMYQLVCMKSSGARLAPVPVRGLSTCTVPPLPVRVPKDDQLVTGGRFASSFLHTITSQPPLFCPLTFCSSAAVTFGRFFYLPSARRNPSLAIRAVSHDENGFPLAECSFLWRKRQLGYATGEEMQFFFKKRLNQASELFDATSGLIGPGFDFIGSLELLRGEEGYAILQNDPESGSNASKENAMNVLCDKLIEAGMCKEEVFDQIIYTQGRYALQSLGEGQGKLVNRIPHFVRDVKEGKLLIPMYSKVALDSSLIVYLLQPTAGRLAGGKAPAQGESLTDPTSDSDGFLTPEDQELARKKESVLQVLGKPFFFVVSEYSLCAEIPSSMLDRQQRSLALQERANLFAVWDALLRFCAQCMIAVHGENGRASMINLVELLRCNDHNLRTNVHRGKVLLDTMGPEVHLLLVGDHGHHGKVCRGVREGTMRTMLMWCPFVQEFVAYS